MTSPKPPRVRVLRVIGLAICALAFATIANAADLTIKVVNSSGGTVSDARVCFSTSDNPPRQASRVTSNDGKAILQNVPQGAYRVIVTRSGFKGIEETVNMAGSDLTKTITLVQGSDDSGLVCNVLTIPSGGYMIMPDLKIVSFQINGGSLSTKNPLVSIGVRLDRNPKFYRISETAESINSAPWILFVPGEPVLYSLGITGFNSYGTRYLYFQAKPGDAGAGSSRVASASIVLEPASLKTHTVTGGELKELLRRAREEWGYTFSSRTIFSTTDRCNDSRGEGVKLDTPTIIVFWGFEGTRTSEKVHDSTFFVGKKLNRFWRIVSVGVEAVPNSYPEGLISDFSPPGLSSEDPKHIVRIKLVDKGVSRWGVPGGVEALLVPPSPCNEYKFPVKSIKLEGPEGFDWRDAFRH